MEVARTRVAHYNESAPVRVSIELDVSARPIKNAAVRVSLQDMSARPVENAAVRVSMLNVKCPLPSSERSRVQGRDGVYLRARSLSGSVGQEVRVGLNTRINLRAVREPRTTLNPQP